jgi:hypothetical protein
MTGVSVVIAKAAPKSLLQWKEKFRKISKMSSPFVMAKNPPWGIIVARAQIEAIFFVPYDEVGGGGNLPPKFFLGNSKRF